MKKFKRCFCLAFILAIALTSCKTEVDDPAPPTYTITYVDGNGKSIDTKTVTQSEGEQGVSIALAEKPGYTSTYKGADGKLITGNYKVTQDIKITVTRTPITYTIKFDVGKGSGETPKDIVATYDREYLLPKNTLTAPEGYKANGWKDAKGTVYTSEQKVKNLTTENGATVTLTAAFVSKTTYSVTFANSSEKAPEAVSLPEECTLNKGDTSVKLTAGEYKLADQTGYIFDGWYDAEGTKVTELSADDTTIYKDITLTAKWKPWTATIFYNYAADNQTIEWGVKTKLATATKEGKTLVGWAKTVGATTKDFDPGQELTWDNTNTISQNYGWLNLYPVWKDLPVIVTITASAPSADGLTDIKLEYNKDASTFQAALDGASTFTWYIDGTEQENEVRDSMSIYRVPDGTHTVTVTAKKDTHTYSATMVVKTTTSTSL
ncbi:MAG: InlB B-repeat-containing protein [Spirochaetaceae bacterium]|nr:InlB B-repeat-containing protein [Spirochaetaceae bacterium]